MELLATLLLLLLRLLRALPPLPSLASSSPVSLKALPLASSGFTTCDSDPCVRR
jgi:hypothetical protein